MLKSNARLGSTLTKIEKKSITGGRTGGEDSSEVDDCRNDDIHQCPCGNAAGDLNCHSTKKD